MSSIGIIANPASGKDIRRLVSYATTIDNQEKVNIVKRIVLAAQAMGVDTVWFMPDTFQIGWAVIEDLSRDEKLTADCRLLDIPLTATSQDTTAAAAEMERLGVGCVVVLGGDGTSRAVAKGIKRYLSSPFPPEPTMCIRKCLRGLLPVWLPPLPRSFQTPLYAVFGTSRSKLR